MKESNKSQQALMHQKSKIFECIIIEMDNSLYPEVKEQLYNHIISLCNLLQGDEEYITIRKSVSSNDKKRRE